MLSAILTLVMAFLLSLGVCEIATRLMLKPPLGDRVELYEQDGSVRADCYPRSGGTHMPIDLGSDREALAFLRQFNKLVIAWPGNPGKQIESDPLPVSESLEVALGRLRERAPLCVLYNLSEESPRRLVGGPGYKETFAVLGDSFAFGQGVPDDETFTTRLADKTKARIRSYAFPGANIAEILQQFELAMKDRDRYRISKILYLYVLNDPYPSSNQTAQPNLLNDFMNIRLSVTPYSSKSAVRQLGKLSSYSALARFALRAYSSWIVSRETIRWYQELHDPNLNPGFATTFEQIRLMRERARRQGIDFVVFVYPLMLDMRHYPLIDAHKHLAEMASRSQVELVDLLPAFQAHPRVTITVHPIDLHPNGMAHEIAATAVAQYLQHQVRVK